LGHPGLGEHDELEYDVEGRNGQEPRLRSSDGSERSYGALSLWSL